MLTIEKLEVVYQRAVTALQGISLAAAPRQIIGVLGTNGAGKSTLLRAISGFHGIDDAAVTEGSIRFEGRPIENSQPHFTTRLGIALVPERDKVFPSLTVAQNLLVPVWPGISRAERTRREARLYDFFPRLKDLRQRTAGLLSGGERQMLAIASALACGPRLLLIDELSLGLAPIVAEEIIGQLLHIRRELSLTMVMVEQSAAMALRTVDYAYVLENGRIVLDGDAVRLRNHPDIQEFYLGRAGGGDRRSYRTVKQYRRRRRWYG
jgi:branched-chain amino acid transport system ATP-binding protein